MTVRDRARLRFWEGEAPESDVWYADEPSIIAHGHLAAHDVKSRKLTITMASSIVIDEYSLQSDARPVFAIHYRKADQWPLINSVVRFSNGRSGRCDFLFAS
jgi:hypothetical protein